MNDTYLFLFPLELAVFHLPVYGNIIKDPYSAFTTGPCWYTCIYYISDGHIYFSIMEPFYPGWYLLLKI